jgi:hypothetical protein
MLHPPNSPHPITLPSSLSIVVPYYQRTLPEGQAGITWETAQQPNFLPPPPAFILSLLSVSV